MTFVSRIKSRHWLHCGLMILAFALVGCNRDQIKVQEVPKESGAASQTAQSADAPTAPTDPHAGMDMNMGSGTQPQVKWTLPTGWQEKALSQMRVGSFNAPGKDGQSADVSIIPLPSMGPEMELNNLNMWRGELQLPPATKAESEPVTVGPGQGKLFEIAGGQTPGRILVGVLDHEGTSWYFKMRGGDAVVRDQKPAFLEFLKSVSFPAAPAVAMADPHAGMTMQPAPAQGGEASGVALPAGWKEIPNPPMLLAKYVIQGSGGAEADVNVSMLAGQGGGVMMNITRWRGQLGLPPLSEEDFSKQTQTVDVAGTQATVVDMTGTDGKTGKKARLVGVIAPQAGDTWFYKLMGDEQIVGQQKDTFMKFIQTAKFSNAP
ncbi:MAG TPA: hypothetical protein VG938_04560 [Verrucomicrobiae bacterium]|jgi:hypothetical protein|nr:hypothetical protein [Verrucomicrobiae bacterium]